MDDDLLSWQEMMDRQDHLAEWLYCPFIGEKIPIDTKIVTLCRLIWRLGIRTLNSCEDNRREYVDEPTVWLCFEGFNDVVMFLTATIDLTDPLDPMIAAMQSINAFIAHPVLDFDAETLNWIVSFRFDQSLLPLIEERLKACLAFRISQDSSERS